MTMTYQASPFIHWRLWPIGAQSFGPVLRIITKFFGNFSSVSEPFKYPLMKVFPASSIYAGPEVTFLTAASFRVFRNPPLPLRCFSPSPFTPFNSSRTIILLHGFHGRLNLIFFCFSANSPLCHSFISHLSVCPLQHFPMPKHLPEICPNC